MLVPPCVTPLKCWCLLVSPLPDAQAPGWPGVPAVCELDKALYSLPAEQSAAEEVSAASSGNASAAPSAAGRVLERAVRAACQELMNAAQHLDDLDQKCA